MGEDMFDFVMKVAFGAGLVIVGLRMFVQPKWHNFLRDYYVDVSGYNWFWGSICTLAGIVFLSLAIKQRIKKQKTGKRETTCKS
jgi:hypothetical protein